MAMSVAKKWIKSSIREVKHVRETVMYLLSDPAGVLDNTPGAKGNTTLGDGPLDQPSVVGSECLWQTEKKDV